MRYNRRFAGKIGDGLTGAGWCARLRLTLRVLGRREFGRGRRSADARHLMWMTSSETRRRYHAAAAAASQISKSQTSCAAALGACVSCIMPCMIHHAQKTQCYAVQHTCMGQHIDNLAQITRDDTSQNAGADGG